MSRLIAPDGEVWSGKHGYLKMWAPRVVKGVFFAALLAVLLVICVRLGEIERGLTVRAGSQEIAKERYDTEMRELHDLKVSLNTLSAWYQEDARNQYRNRR